MRDINSLNRVILIGRLGGKPEKNRLPQTERWYARFTMATNERFFNKNTRETVDRTEWHKVVVWGNQVEFCEKYLDKGRQILLEGKLRTRSWQDKEGNKRTTTEIEAVNIILLGKREESSATSDTTDLDSAPYGRSGVAGAPAGGGDFPDEEAGGGTAGSGGDDDIPF
jgi:single-strand DNA-binding protein